MKMKLEAVGYCEHTYIEEKRNAVLFQEFVVFFTRSQIPQQDLTKTKLQLL